ncbi:Endonuclease/exonuclease/phosphatase [Ephemerocybe angulata]|uniref:Endonuclease/exonuclease/phosphatase n=1 Tax=Ephemerocybe angulata TaxID=980116 RepID=A0A8H6HMR8_9AGAR|nr:Endonuclease/exonuclease/phosphatase [Tulosesus angulatus]
MRQNRIGILALQETHLTKKALDEVNRTYKKQMVIIQSSDPDNTGSKGVAFALNKRLVAWEETKTKELEPGRALLLTIPWRNQGKTITALAVYAPNIQKENERFWNDLDNKYFEGGVPRPDILLGDFNMVEEPIDRLPPHGDAIASVERLRALKDRLHLFDGWRQENPTKPRYTYVQDGSGSQSRIDRIYATKDFMENSRGWTSIISGIATADHRVVIAQFFDPGSPFIGKGRWAMPETILSDPEFIKFATKKGLEAVESAKTRNVQEALATYKLQINGEARDIIKRNYPKIQERLDNLQNDLEKILDSPTMAPQDKRKSSAA